VYQESEKDIQSVRKLKKSRKAEEWPPGLFDWTLKQGGRKKTGVETSKGVPEGQAILAPWSVTENRGTEADGRGS